MLTARALHASQVRRGEAHFDVLDWSSLVAGTRVAAGLDGFDSSKVCGSARICSRKGLPSLFDGQHSKVVPED